MKGINEMTAPTDLVSISQAALDAYAANVESVVSVLKPYIAGLIAGQTPQLNPADVTALTQAMTDADALEPPPPVTP
jgi:hypothetical protein